MSKISEVMAGVGANAFRIETVRILGNVYNEQMVQSNTVLMDWMERLYRSSLSLYGEFELNISNELFVSTLKNEFVEFYLTHKSKYRALSELDKTQFTNLADYANTQTQLGTNTSNQGYQGFDAANQQSNFRKDTNELNVQNRTTNRKEGLELLASNLYVDIGQLVKKIVFNNCITIY